VLIAGYRAISLAEREITRQILVITSNRFNELSNTRAPHADTNAVAKLKGRDKTPSTSAANTYFKIDSPIDGVQDT
jgi:hypothetical protein